MFTTVAWTGFTSIAHLQDVKEVFRFLGIWPIFCEKISFDTQEF